MGGDHQADLMTKEQPIKGDEESQMVRDEVRPRREPEVAPEREADKGTQAEKSGWERWMRAKDLMETGWDEILVLLCDHLPREDIVEQDESTKDDEEMIELKVAEDRVRREASQDLVQSGGPNRGPKITREEVDGTEDQEALDRTTKVAEVQVTGMILLPGRQVKVGQTGPERSYRPPTLTKAGGRGPGQDTQTGIQRIAT